jgi:hypothetical protein
MFRALPIDRALARFAPDSSNDARVSPEVNGMMSSRFALVASLSALLLVACGGSQPTEGAPSTAAVQPVTRSLERSLNGYYLAKFTTVVGRSPESSFCFRFMPSGRWNSTGSVDFGGTYLTAGKELFASAYWPASAAVYMTLHGPINAKQGSGEFIVLNDGGDIYGGGTYTMAGKQNSTCS